MANVFPGRFTANIEGDFVVFLIGMRVNKLFQVHKWLPTASSMPPMLMELYRQPELGFLGAEQWFNLRGTMLVQYWRSFEQLEAYARAREASHLPAWQRFRKQVGDDGSVGIWHETYLVRDGQYEVVYGNMPLMGLARVSQHLPATGRWRSAKSRLGQTESTPVAAEAA